MADLAARAPSPSCSRRCPLPKLLRPDAFIVLRASPVTRAALVMTRPCRAPHHAISDVGLIGGGHVPMPPEESLAYENNILAAHGHDRRRLCVSNRHRRGWLRGDQRLRSWLAGTRQLR
jgi:hypothetical protein